VPGADDVSIGFRLAGGIPFLSDEDLKTQLDKAGVPPKTADAIVTETPAPASTGCARRCRCSPSSR